MDKKEKKIVDRIKDIITSKTIDFEEIKSYIVDHIAEVSYTSILSQKIMVKLYLNKKYSQIQKNKIYNIFSCHYTNEKVQNYILFIETMCQVDENYRTRIREQIQKEFSSMFVFLACLGMYTIDNPQIIEYPKNLIIKIAMDVLDNDGRWNENQGKITINRTTYLTKQRCIDNIYKTAIKCGCIKERFDDISFGREEVTNVEYIGKPYIHMQIVDYKWKYRLMYASAYYSSVFNHELSHPEYLEDPLYNFYKCVICKKSKILNVSPDIENIIQDLLRRQFASETFLDYLVRHTGDLGNTTTYVLSIYLYVYVQLLFLLLVYKESYIVISYDHLRNNMCGSGLITDEEFHRIYDLCFTEKKDNVLCGTFYRNGTRIIIGAWMFNSNYTVFEDARNRVFNSKNDKLLGKELDYFGKHIYENLVKYMAIQHGWKTLKSNIRIKNTDFDLVTFKEGVVILAQVKANHWGESPYSLWKANETIGEANRQINKCRIAIREDKYLLYSNLKREKIVQSIQEIKEVKYLIISGNSYLAGDGDVPVISIEDWKNVLMLDPWSDILKDFLNCPPSMYRLENVPKYTESVVETDEFAIFYNEIELEDE